MVKQLNKNILTNFSNLDEEQTLVPLSHKTTLLVRKVNTQMLLSHGLQQVTGPALNLKKDFHLYVVQTVGLAPHLGSDCAETQRHTVL